MWVYYFSPLSFNAPRWQQQIILIAKRGVLMNIKSQPVSQELEKGRHSIPRLLPIKSVLEAAGGISRSTAYRWSSDPKNPFPKPIKIGPNSVAWREEDLMIWRDLVSTQGVQLWGR